MLNCKSSIFANKLRDVWRLSEKWSNIWLEMRASKIVGINIAKSSTYSNVVVVV